MNENKNLLHHIADWWQTRQSARYTTNSKSHWLPSPGNILFTLLIAGLLIITQRAWATNTQNINAPGPSATTINYQGRLADDAGNPQTGTFGMSFAIWDAASGGSIIWGPENHSAVPVTNGLFNVGLGSQTGGGIPTTVWNGDRYLEITVGGETLNPRELIRSVPIAGMALTVPNGAITPEKASGLLASASGQNVKVFFGETSYTPSTTMSRIEKTVVINEPCSNKLKVSITPNFNFHSDVAATIGSPWDGSQFTVFLTQLDGGTWSANQHQNFQWIAICQ